MNVRSLAVLVLGLTGCSNQPSGPSDAGAPPADTSPAAIDSGPPDAGPLPDLTIDSTVAQDSAHVVWEVFAPGACEIAEGCVTAPGNRRLLRFDTLTPNHGQADLVLGPPSMNPDQFTYSMCHMHYHFNGYADYRLLQGASEVATGHKQAFCLEDFQQYDTSPGIRTTQQFTCTDQGISQGWADLYYSALPCQWIDVTDVPAGDYMLEITINGARNIVEASYDDNQALIPVHIPDDATVDPLAACTPAGALSGNRDCGWANSGSFDCTAGTTYRIGCGAACGLGTCTNPAGDPDTLLRVCADNAPCTSHAAIGFADDGCGTTYCSLTTFVCPASGRYTVMTAPFADGGTDVCNAMAVPM